MDWDGDGDEDEDDAAGCGGRLLAFEIAAREGDVAVALEPASPGDGPHRKDAAEGLIAARTVCSLPAGSGRRARSAVAQRPTTTTQQADRLERPPPNRVGSDHK